MFFFFSWFNFFRLIHIKILIGTRFPYFTKTSALAIVPRLLYLRIFFSHVDRCTVKKSNSMNVSKSIDSQQQKCRPFCWCTNKTTEHINNLCVKRWLCHWFIDSGLGIEQRAQQHRIKRVCCTKCRYCDSK